MSEKKAIQELAEAVEAALKMWKEEINLRVSAESRAYRAENLAEYERSRAVKAEFALLSINDPAKGLPEAVRKFCDAFDAGVVDTREARIQFGILLGRDNLRDPDNYLGIVTPQI